MRIVHCLFVLILMYGYNGSQSWDTSFAIQAIISTNIAEEYGATLRKAHDYIKDSQVLLCRIFLLLYLKIILFICSWPIVVCFEGLRRLSWRSKFLVLSHFKRCLAILNCRSWMAYFWLHCRRIEGQVRTNSSILYNGKNLWYLFLCAGCFITINIPIRNSWEVVRCEAVIWCCKCSPFLTGNC